MSLKGHLEVFPLEEVLRLLSRSKKTGCLRVDSAAHVGHIFMGGGSISYATVDADDYLVKQAINAGLVDKAALRHGGVVALPEALVEGVKASALADFIREEVVESLYRIRKAGAGAFEFDIEVEPMFRTGQSFDSDVAISEADRRAVEWLEVERRFSDLSAPLRMTFALPDENEATITPSAWKLLSRLGAGHSINELSTTLGISRYRAARELADQMSAGRVELIPTAAEAVAPAPEPEVTYSAPTWAEPVATPEHPMWTIAIDDEPPAEEPGAEVVVSEELDAPLYETPAVEAPATGEAIFDEPGIEEAPEAEAEEEEEDVISSGTDGGWWAEAMGEIVKPNTNADADAFLESVFGELDGNADAADEPEQGFGVGLLRRRRMGAVSRELKDEDN